MAHYSRLSKVVIDVPPADHDRELAFWNSAADQPLTRFDRHPEYHGVALHGQEFWLLIQRLGQGSARGAARHSLSLQPPTKAIIRSLAASMSAAYAAGLRASSATRATLQSGMS